MLLGWCPGVSRFAPLVQSSLIADPDTMFVEVAGMGTWRIFRTGHVQLSVPCDIVMVADAVEAPCPMACLQCFHGEVPVAACRTAVYHYQINLSHFFNFSILQSFNFSIFQSFNPISSAALNQERRADSSKDGHNNLYNLFNRILFHISIFI
jgi:hypothetical protein